MGTASVPAAQPAVLQRLPALDRFPPLWNAAAMAAGVALGSLIPTSTGSATAIGSIFPELDGSTAWVPGQYLHPGAVDDLRGEGVDDARPQVRPEVHRHEGALLGPQDPARPPPAAAAGAR